MPTIFVFNVNMFQNNRAFWLLYDICFLANICLMICNADVQKKAMKYGVLLFEFCVVLEKRMF